LQVILHARPAEQAVVIDDVKIVGITGLTPLAFFEQVDIAQVYGIDAGDKDFQDYWIKTGAESRLSSNVNLSPTPRDSNLTVILTTENGIGGSTRYANLDLVVICDAFTQPLAVYLGIKRGVKCEEITEDHLKRIALLTGRPMREFKQKVFK